MLVNVPYVVKETIQRRLDMINIIDIELQLIGEEIAKLPRTTDTSYVPPDVLELVDERIFGL